MLTHTLNLLHIDHAEFPQNRIYDCSTNTNIQNTKLDDEKSLTSSAACANAVSNEYVPKRLSNPPGANRCYSNATVQCLLNCKTFYDSVRQSFLDKDSRLERENIPNPEEINNKISFEFQNLLKGNKRNAIPP